MGGVEIKPLSSMTYLGIILDQKLRLEFTHQNKSVQSYKNGWPYLSQPLTIYMAFLLLGCCGFINKSYFLESPMVLMYGVIPLH